CCESAPSPCSSCTEGPFRMEGPEASNWGALHPQGARAVDSRFIKSLLRHLPFTSSVAQRSREACWVSPRLCAFGATLGVSVGFALKTLGAGTRGCPYIAEG